MNSRRHTAAGFTLIDLVVAIVVLGVGVLALSAAIGVVGRQMRASQRDNRIAAVAQAEMERLLARGHDALVSGERAMSAYSVHWDVSGVDPKQVVLVVRHESSGGTETDTLATLVGRRRR